MTTVRSVNEIIAELPDPATLRNRIIVAIAGPPGSGKSTLAEALVDALNARAADCAVVFPMDGFHYDNAILEPRGLLPRKGAPETFDVAGYRAFLERLGASPDSAVAVPVFDRDLELSRAAARIIEPRHRIVLTEGNYLLLDDPPWQNLRSLFGRTVFLDVPAETLRERLIGRWLHYGFDPEAARAKAEGNDMVNARLVIDRSAAADLRYVQT